MDLLLTHGYFVNEDPKEARIMKPYAPLGILYLTSHLRAKGFDIEVFDSTFSSRHDLFQVLRTASPSVLGIYANLMTRRNVIEILQAAKEAGWKTIVGGPEPAAYVKEYLEAGADIVVIGEAEQTLEELLPALKQGSFAALAKVDGIAFLGEAGEIQRTQPRALIANLDAQPWPSRESINVPRYIATWRTHHGVGSVSIITARGCPYRCRWCSHAVYGNTHRRRKPTAVVDEVEWIMGRYSPDMIWIADDVFTIHHGWLFQYAAEMKRRNLKIPFECISRADRLNPQVADALAELGCFRIWIGSESGSQSILNSMERGVTVEQVQNAVRLSKSRGIETGMFLMWGYEGERMEDIEATVDHVKHADPDIFLTTVAYPIKGTPYFNQVTDRVVPPPSWQDGSDRDFKIRGRHSRRFYQYADQLLHSEVELQRLLTKQGLRASYPEIESRIAEAREGLRTSYQEVEA
ncbi:MAG TPA: radical SAM protein [Terriglobia bacterium]|nr:radical SAM protein [Terriglobia bacterium]